MSEFKPLFSTTEVGEFKPTPKTRQYSIEQQSLNADERKAAFQRNIDPTTPLEHSTTGSAVNAEPDVPSPEGHPSNEESTSAMEDQPALLPEAIEEMLENARQEGIEEGRRAAEAEFADVQAMVEHLQAGLEEIEALHRQTLKSVARDIGEMVNRLSQRVLYDNLVLHPKALTTIVEDALNAMPEDEKVWISVNPDHLEKLQSMLNIGRDIEFRPDESIEAGFRIQNKHSSIDSTLQTMLEGIQAAVAQWQETA